MEVNYKDITKEWQKSKGNEEGIITNSTFYIDKEGNRYDIDNKYVILDYTKNEEDIAKWYAKTKKVNIEMLPRVLFPPGVKSGDFIETTTKTVWEIKEPIGNNNNTIYNQFKHQKSKSNNFIIDIHKSRMANQTVIKSVQKVYNSKHMNWINTVIILRNQKIIRIFKQKK